MMTMTVMGRRRTLDAVIGELEIVGNGEDTGVDYVRVAPERFLLIENNVGSAAHMQSHWLSTHSTLDNAWRYHEGQEYAEDWTVDFAVDLDTNERFVPGHTSVKWEPMP